MPEGLVTLTELGAGKVGTYELCSIKIVDNTVSQEETSAQELKGARDARKAQTASYRKSKESRQGKGLVRLVTYPTRHPQQRPQMWKSGEKERNGGDSDDDDDDDDGGDEEEGQSGHGKDGELDESKDEEIDDDEENVKEKVVEEMVGAKGRGKVKARAPKCKKLTDDPSTPFTLPETNILYHKSMHEQMITIRSASPKDPKTKAYMPMSNIRVRRRFALDTESGRIKNRICDESSL
ncbi:hypothetical protein Syun_019347 [Stephania yunnanensis]|uniref:Uncharacterized protein n=1 Tax=Stephania yunnanensis TaxID=152371 RepID=A0AAP0IUQ2_9MAGN